MQSWKDTNVTAITMITSLKNFVGKIETIVEPKPINDQTNGDAKPSFTPIGKQDLTILTLSRVKGKEKERLKGNQAKEPISNSFQNLN